MVRCSLRLHRIGHVLIHELVPQASTSELDQSRSPRRRRELDRSRLGTSAQGSSTPSSSPSRDPSLTSEPSQLSWRVEVRTVGGGQEDLVQRRTGRVTSGDRWDSGVLSHRKCILVVIAVARTCSSIGVRQAASVRAVEKSARYSAPPSARLFLPFTRHTRLSQYCFPHHVLWSSSVPHTRRQVVQQDELNEAIPVRGDVGSHSQ